MMVATSSIWTSHQRTESADTGSAWTSTLPSARQDSTDLAYMVVKNDITDKVEALRAQETMKRRAVETLETTLAVVDRMRQVRAATEVTLCGKGGSTRHDTLGSHNDQLDSKRDATCRQTTTTLGRRPIEGNEWFLAATSPLWNTMESRFVCSSVATVAHLLSSSLAGRE
uniref:Uncharacterized protein n=1 Tax=Plectus sambesii TaxID=2011161 RepID=A0A914WTV8_9BILA